MNPLAEYTPAFARRTLTHTVTHTITAALVLLLLAAGSADAQSRGGRGGGRQRTPPAASQSAPPQQVPEPAAPPPEHASISWPWLEYGAVLCNSRDDLYKYQTRPAGGSNAEPALACWMLLKQTGIQILDHDGPSRTKVVTTDDPPETGWTNSFLPATAPAH